VLSKWPFAVVSLIGEGTDGGFRFLDCCLGSRLLLAAVCTSGDLLLREGILFRANESERMGCMNGSYDCDGAECVICG